VRISIVIPCFNERSTVAEVIGRVEAAHEHPEILVVDDGSTDGSVEVLRDLAAAGRITLIEHDVNLGKGAAVRSGFAAASGDIVLIHDADLEYDPADHHRLIAPIIDGRADAVFGSRFVGGDAHRVLYFWHAVGNRFLTLVSNCFTNLNLTDMECCLKAFRGDVARRIEVRERGFGVEPELVAHVSRLGVRVFEVGVSYAGRTYAEGKKITWRDGVRAVWVIVRVGLFGR